MERRSNIRKGLHMSIVVQVPAYNKRMVSATLLDISPGGAFIETEVLLPANAGLILELKLPGKFVQNKFRLNARIVHRALRGVGVAFVGVPVGIANALTKALARYEGQPVIAGFLINTAITS
jgi:hypothetical protein